MCCKNTPPAGNSPRFIAPPKLLGGLLSQALALPQALAVPAGYRNSGRVPELVPGHGPGPGRG